ncbi:hypothetical protein ACIOJE_38345 [Kitasatospora sp. NPDC087861]|uniref:hypothetical protein n=1 Tax=unclassified Kitasatospora TaxID=2633591 RepID=UPI00247443EC|nr:hypothetical protein [Kitasatospora sp. MAA19]
MTASAYALPAAIAVAAVSALAVTAVIARSRRLKSQEALSAARRAELSKERRDAWRRGLSVLALGVGCLMLFTIAAVAGWLSFGAQRQYAHSHNGGHWDAATGFALLLDAGALGLSLFRFFESLTLRSSAVTRLFLLAFIGGSAEMNFLHAPAPDFGSRFVAIVPPLVYAVLLEMLLHKIEQVVMGKRPKRRSRGDARGYSLLLWVPFIGYPRKMWRAWRADLLTTIENVRAPGSTKPLPLRPPSSEAPEPPQPTPTGELAAAPAPAMAQEAPAPVTSAAPVVLREAPPVVWDAPAPAAVPAPAAAREEVRSPAPRASAPSDTVPIPARVATADQEAAPAPVAPLPPAASAPVVVPVPAKPVTKASQLFIELSQMIKQGDLRVLSDQSQVRNAAAYAANLKLGQAACLGNNGLFDKDGAVRSALKQLLPDLQRVHQEHLAAQAAAASAALPPQSRADVGGDAEPRRDVGQPDHGGQSQDREGVLV